MDIGLNDNVYVGTFASDIGGIPEADFIAKWNGSSWSALGGTLSGNGQLTDMPRNITVDSRSGVDIVYVGNLNSGISDINDSFTEVGFFIKWNGTEWEQALPDVVITDNYVTDVALAPGGGLVVGGWFRATDNVYRDRCNTNQRSVAYFDGVKTYALGMTAGGNPSFDGQVDSVVFNKDGKLLVGGSFTSASGNSSASRIAISNVSFTPEPTTASIGTPIGVPTVSNPSPAVTEFATGLRKSIQFSSGTSYLSQTHKKALRRSVASSGKDATYVVTGTAGFIPGLSEAQVKKLARVRANSVKAYLVRLGINQAKITVKTRIVNRGTAPKTKILTSFMATR